jgi:hypothetical protein
MNADLRDKYYGHSIDDWISKIPGELAVDAVGLWQIVSFGRQGFGLEGNDLVKYVRKALYALFAKGAKPVVGATDGIHFWTPIDLGEAPEKIADSIIAEWLNTGREPDAGGIWFALPHIYEALRRGDASGLR